MAFPDEKEVRAALGRLVAHGIDSVWLPEAQVLLELPAVREEIEQSDSDRAVADALRGVLSAAVESLGQSQYRRLLTIVLGLEPAYAEMSAGLKRQIAGREFRGGSRPVSAGTIRQHHEPKALDALASVLCEMPAQAPGLVGESATEESSSPIEWHPVLHNLWAGERLVFWRLSFGRYDPAGVRERIRETMDRAEISSWTAYEAMGSFDLLVRAWLPLALSPADFGTKVFSGLGDLLQFDFFAVDRVVRHWPWIQENRTMREPSHDLLEDPLPRRDIELVNSGEDPDRLRQYRDLSLVTPAREKKGIGFMVAVAPAGPGVLPMISQQAVVEEGMASLLGRLEGSAFSGLSLYAGSGFASYLVLGRVDPASFNELGEALVRPLGEIVGMDSGRTYTFILSASAPLAQVETMSAGSLDPVELSAEDLLRQDEGAHFEVVAGAFADGPERAAGFNASLARTVTGFLNTDGGTVVIGAAEGEQLQHGDPQLAELFAGAPEVGRYAVRGIGEEDVGAFERRLLDALATRIEPEPSSVQVRFEQIAGRTVCLLTVSRIIRTDGGPWFYCREGRGSTQFFVRRGFRSVKLAGAEADAYKAQRAGTRGTVFTA